MFGVDENCLEWSKQQKGGGSESNIIITVINKDDRSFFTKIRKMWGSVLEIGDKLVQTGNGLIRFRGQPEG